MTAFDVRIDRLPAMRMAVVRVVSERPEADAWLRLSAWAAKRGLMNAPADHPVYGYTCQPPVGNGKLYGYAWWIGVDAGTEIVEPVDEVLFPGGLYAVTTHLGAPDPLVWKRLWDWTRSSPYRWRKTHELEKVVNPLAPEASWVFDLHLPIEEL